jgi:hypothetical protein
MDLLIKRNLDYSSIEKQETGNRIVDINLLVDAETSMYQNM